MFLIDKPFFYILLLSVFHKHDHNGDALLTKEEFRDFFLDVMGPGSTIDEADEAFHFLDRDKSGEIDLDEFKTGILRYNKNQSSELPRKIFSYLHTTHCLSQY